MMRTIWTAGLLCVLASVRPVQAQETRLYWGDTHLHTSYSFDVYLFGTFAATPDTAYRFARGLPVGGDIEYADEVTLGRSLAGRRELA